MSPDTNRTQDHGRGKTGGRSLASFLTQSPNRLAIVVIGLLSLFLTWAEIHALVFEVSIRGISTDIGKIYLGILVLIGLSEVTSNPKKIKRAWLWGGLALVGAVSLQMYHLNTVFQEAEAEAAADGIESAIQTDFGLGIYVAFLGAIGIVYVGYQLEPSQLTPALRGSNSEHGSKTGVDTTRSTPAEPASAPPHHQTHDPESVTPGSSGEMSELEPEKEERTDPGSETGTDTTD